MMEKFPRDRMPDLIAFYGNPDANKDGHADLSWEKASLIRVPIPWTAQTSWDPKVFFKRGILIHKKLAPSLKLIFDDIWQAFGKSQAAIVRAGMHKCGGSYNFRPMRGSSRLSTHAFGAAIDWNPVQNAMDSKGGNMDARVVDAYRRGGWRWLGPTQDPMHFQGTS